MITLTTSKDTNKPTGRHYWLPIIGALSLSIISAGANAKPHHKDYARVTQVTPIYETITIKEPYQQCYMEERVVRDHHSRRNNSSATPTIIGALIGGAIGNELGHNKSNKRVGAVAGAILGGSIANDLKQRPHYGNRNNHYTTSEQVCNTRHRTRHEQQITAYNVDYKYRGKRYSTIMNSHPGDRIRVEVDVRPAHY